MGFWFTFFLWVATFVLQDYFRQKLPRRDPSGIGDFQAPTATQGRPVPQIAGGTIRIEGTNVVWFGDWDAEPVTTETGIIFKRDEVVGYKYRIGACLAQFMGECAGMTAIYIGDDKVFDYVTDASSVPQTVVDIDLPELFGGEKSGGGFRGRFRCYTGQENQPQDPYLSDASRVGPTQSTWPGLTYVTMTNSEEPIEGPLGIPFGTLAPETRGAIIGEANQLRDIRIEFQTYDTLANGGLGNDLGLTGDRHIIGRDANPIAAAYRVLTDPLWSINSSVVDASNFQAAAITCYDEGLGYSRTVDSEIEAFELLAEIEKHIDGYIGPNPVTGLIEVKLARDDYVPASEFQADESNILAVNDYSRPDWPQTKNDVKVRFVNRDKNYSEDHAVIQDMANRIITGRPSPMVLRFEGVRDAAVANRIVSRTSLAYFFPLSKFQLELDRSAELLRPGDVMVVNHPYIDGTDLPVRITRIRTGDAVKQTIKADVVEDVFRVETGVLADPPPSDFVPPSPDPVNVTSFATMLSPRWMLTKNEQTFEPRLLYMVERDVPNQAAVLEWQKRTTFGSGSYGTDILETIPAFSFGGTLRGPLSWLIDNANDGLGSATYTDFSIDGTLSGAVGAFDQELIEGLFVINPGANNEEIVYAPEVNPDATGVVCSNVIRGVGDTGIHEHAAGEPVFFLDSNVYLQENQGIAEGNGYRYKIAGQAFGTTQDFAGLSEQAEIEVFDRHNRPAAPLAIRWPDLNTSNYFTAGDLNAIVGFSFDVLQRKIQTNPIYAAQLRDDNDVAYTATAFATENPQINLYVYDLTANGAPTSTKNADGDAVWTTSFTLNSAAGVLDSADEEIDIALADLQANLVSGNNYRWEFDIEYQTADNGIPTGVQSPSIWHDKVVTFPPQSLSLGAAKETVLLLDATDPEVGAESFIDRGPNKFTITTSSSAVKVVDSNAPPLSGKAIRIPAGEYLEIADDDEFTLDMSVGFQIEARVLFVSNAPTSSGGGAQPFVSQWRESDNERSWWVGMSNDDYLLQLSTDGTAEANEAEDEDSLSTGAWYEFSFIVAKGLPAAFGGANVFFHRSGGNGRQDVTGVTALHNSSAPLRIGMDSDGNDIDILLEQLRILKIPLRAGTGGYALETVPFWGREKLIPLLFNFEDDAAGSMIFESADLNRWSCNAQQTTAISVAQAKFGTQSLSVPGGGSGDATLESTYDGLIVQDSGDATPFNGEDFTIEGFVRFDTLPSTLGRSVALVSKYSRTVTNPWGDFIVGVNSSDQLTFYLYYNTSNNAYTPAATGMTPAVDTWYHFAIVREGNALAMLFEGNRVFYDDDYFITNPVNADFGNQSAAEIALGRLRGNSTNSLAGAWVLDGYLDEIRIQNCKAEYDTSQATYTVPTAAFPSDGPRAQPPPVAVLPNNWEPGAL